MSEHDVLDVGAFAADLPHIASRIFNTPLLIEPSKLQAILWAISHRMGFSVDRPPPDTAVMQPAAAVGRWERRDAERGSGLIIDEGVGILSITGTLVNRGRWIGTYSGLQSYEGIAQQLRMAADDNRVREVLLDLNTYGGEAGGVADLASEIRELTSVKPVTALIADAAASAGYWLAAAANEVVVTETGLTGSIGVVLTHQDLTEMARMKGVKITQIHAGADKLIGSPFKPLTEADTRKLQAEVDQLYNLFVTRMAEYRGLDPTVVRGTEAGVYRAQVAIDAGLADRMMSGRALLAELQARASNSGSSRTTPRSTTMTKPTQGGAETPAATYTQEQLDAACAKARAEGKAEGVAEGKTAGLAEGEAKGKTGFESVAAAARAEGAQAERERIQAVEAAVLPGHEALIRELKFDGKTTGAEAAARVVTAERAKLGRRVDDLTADAAAARVPSPAAPSEQAKKPAVDKSMPAEERCKAEWMHDPQLRAEFGTVEDYIAYTKASEGGHVRVLRDRIAKAS